MQRATTILVTGGAGFIGSTLIRQLLSDPNCSVVNLDKLTYAGNVDSLALVADCERYSFVRADVCDGTRVREILRSYQPDAIFHLAAESHVDRSIDAPAAFVQTNVVGTSVLLDAAHDYLRAAGPAKRSTFRFIHVSTDEVYGSAREDERFVEGSAYRPNSPYAATKAAADHLARAWYRTYGFPVIVSNCGNNFGPFQFPEKLVPLMILNALNEKPLPVYGDGKNVRDWIYVEDHCSALRAILARGKAGETYLIGADSPSTNIDIVRRLCRLLDEARPRHGGKSYSDLIEYVDDRPGHDRRYALDSTKIRRELGWRPEVNLDEGLARTVEWYIENVSWCERAMAGRYGGERLGLRR